MSGKSPEQAAAELNTMRGIAMAAWVPWLGLCEADPMLGGAEFTDTTAPGYARISPTLALPSQNQTSVSVATSFPLPAGTWPIANYIGIWDAQVAGVLRYSWPLTGTTADRTATLDRPIQVPVGSIIIRHT